ncbi:MAG: multicopper oxidase domain-containing protein [Luteitalea sp.]|nr:multicopper oxidase domain-containing protein [Luteitalea sp.]
MNPYRRNFLRGVATVAGVSAAARTSAQHAHSSPPERQAPAGERSGERSDAQRATTATSEPSSDVVSVETPDVPRMPWRWETGVKVFDIRAEHVRTEFLPGRTVDTWGFNGSMPGPTIEVNEGDRVRFVVENRLPELFSMHWHGLEIPVNMDGVPGISQKPIEPGGTFVYEFTLRQNGTFFYHSHMAMQEMMGMIGLFIIHPPTAHRPRVDRDFGLIFQGWAILPNNTIPNTLAMEFNWLTINGKAGPATTPMLVKRGERVRVRMVNLGMDHHPIHLHGNTFYVTGTEGGRIRTSAGEPGNTVLLGVAQARDVEFEASNLGDWMLHCHLPHHMMNQMASMVGPIMMSHGRGLQPQTMESGMGMVDGRALADESGPAFGRTLAVGAERERPVANMPLAGASHTAHAQSGRAGRGLIPGYPQDMFMDMDEMFAGKPETYGLAPGWTGGMMGMMTLVRVLEPALFDKIQQLKAAQASKGAE